MSSTSRLPPSLQTGGPLEVIPLGAGCEVGRSCIIVSYNQRSVMLDCGIHPAHSGVGSLPIFDAFDVQDVDLCLVTHFHLDHCGAVPYFLSKTAFKGKLYMTDPTLAICKLLWSDYTKMAANARGAKHINEDEMRDGDEKGTQEEDAPLYDDNDVEHAMQTCNVMDFNQQLEYRGIKFTCYKAGHVLGACMFMVEIAGVRFLYTGDYSRELDRHIPQAEFPEVDAHVLICESTYGIRIHDERKSREQRFLRAVQDILKRNGKCLLPVFALGRSQELVFILEELWSQHPEIQHIPLINISSITEKSMLIYETFVNMCGDPIKQKANEGKNPFELKFCKTVKNLDAVRHHVYQDAPCVIVAAPGMLQNGASREIFEAWAGDARNGVILTGYTVKGTLADELKNEPDSIELPDRIIKRRCSFDQISFSAHADYNQTKEFIEKLKAPNVILVHGERGEMMRLKEKLISERPALSVFTPEILQSLCLEFENDRCVKVVGQLATDLNRYISQSSKAKRIRCEEASVKKQTIIDEAIEGDDRRIDGAPSMTIATTVEADSHDKLEIANNTGTVEATFVATDCGEPLLLYPSDLAEYTNLLPTTLQQTLRIKLNAPFVALQASLEELYEEIEVLSATCIRVCNRVLVRLEDNNEIVLEWQGSSLGDLVSDSIAFLALELSRDVIENENVQLSQICNKSEETIFNVVLSFLKEQYNSVEIVNKDTKKPSDKNDETHSKLIRFTVRDPLMQGTSWASEVEIDFAGRMVMSANRSVESKVRENLRRLECSLLTLQPF